MVQPMQVLAVTPEIFPLIKTGGLADVTGALPLALAGQGVAVKTLVPGYPQVMGKFRKKKPVLQYPALQGGKASVLAAEVAGLDLLVLDAPHLFDRPGGPYGDMTGRRLAGQLAALRGAEPGRRRDRCRRRSRLAARHRACA